MSKDNPARKILVNSSLFFCHVSPLRLQISDSLTCDVVLHLVTHPSRHALVIFPLNAKSLSHAINPSIKSRYSQVIIRKSLRASTLWGIASSSLHTIIALRVSCELLLEAPLAQLWMKARRWQGAGQPYPAPDQRDRRGNSSKARYIILTQTYALLGSLPFLIASSGGETRRYIALLYL